jgi:hypothetical protein
MICVKCRSDNPEYAKFCWRCAADLMAGAQASASVSPQQTPVTASEPGGVVIPRVPSAPPSRPLSHLARAGVFVAFFVLFAICGVTLASTVFSSGVTHAAAESRGYLLGQLLCWTGFVVWALTSFFPGRWRTTAATCITAAIANGAVLLFFVFILSDADSPRSAVPETTPSGPSSSQATPPEVLRQPAERLPREATGGTDAIQPPPSSTQPNPFLIPWRANPSIQDFHTSAQERATGLFKQARAICAFRGRSVLKPTRPQVTVGSKVDVDELCDVPQAISLYRQGLTLNSRDAQAHDELGNLYQVARKPALAMQEDEAALALEPSNAYYLLHVGDDLRRQGRREEARQMYDRAERQYHAAEELAKQLNKTADPQFLFELGQAKAALLGDPAAALQYYDRACKSGYDIACSQAIFTRFNSQHSDESPAPSKKRENCCDCGPELSNNECFLKCNALIPRCSQ